MAATIAMPQLRAHVHAAVYLVAGRLCLEVARDYDHDLMRLSWLLFAGEAFVLALYFLLGAPLSVTWPDAPLRSQVALALVPLELSCLLGGMVVTWWQLRRFGLGFHALGRDWVAVGLILTGMVVFFGLSLLGGWMNPMMATSRVLLFLAAAVGVLLNRFCQQMGGGEIARVIRFIIAYAATRCFMNVVFAVDMTWDGAAQPLEEFLRLVFPWIFIMGVTLRARVTVHAQAELARPSADVVR
ncbi:MAG: hypothetical protein JST11_08700 [Acidobacteria bacterium]|nr:hypothetical protein [Acidobacteriota bacterium]